MNGRMVIDSGVAAKWFLNDELDADLATDLLQAMLADDLELHAPRLFIYEVANVLSKVCRQSQLRSQPTRLTKPLALRALEKLFQLPIQLAEPSQRESCEALELSVDYSKSQYDSTYIRLADQLDSVWCTADEKVLRHLPPGFPTHRVVALRTLRSTR